METLLRRHIFIAGPPLARWVRRGGPRTCDPMNDDPIIKCSPDVILCRYHVLIRQNASHESRFDDCLALVPEVNKKQTQKSRFDDFLALAPEVDEINPRSLDLMSLWPWLQKSAKSLSEVLI